ncbi:VOC family protein [Gordonia metallireducens]|uniref:VOC family protein n=1 Tax=Gordonia metallireducens TaxID=2897779 RepID=UPI001E3F28AA|nr:VOC family protein [Gordonia metallireducens]
MATATIGSLLLSSDDPGKLARWYATAFEAKVESTGDGGPGYDVVGLDGFHLMFDKRDDVSGRNSDGARVILNVEVDDPRATAARLDALGVQWVRPLKERDGNWFGTAMGIAGVRVSRQTTVMVYPKDDHRPAEFTVLNIAVDDLEKTVDDLVGKGVGILRYDGFEHDERGIVRGGDGEPDIAWFTDPSGNILSVLSA